MRLDPHKCPKCDQPATGIVEIVHCLTAIEMPDDEGFTDWDPETMTRVWWDTSEPDLVEKRATVQCDQGHEWEAEFYWEEKPEPETNATETASQEGSAAP